MDMYLEFQNDVSTTLLCFILKYAKSLQNMYELNPQNITHLLRTSHKYDHTDLKASGYNRLVNNLTLLLL